MKVVSILDYGMGNLKSVQNALEFFKIRYLITNEKNKIDDSDLLILPGVGSFKQAMINIKSLGLDDIIKENVIKLEKPILGICLGMQLFADEGEEDGISKGLGLIPGRTVKLNSGDFPIPHVGFNEINWNKKSQMNEEKINEFYFVHSYHFKTLHKEHILGTTNYGTNFISAVWNKNIYGVQFHPEKSQSNGLLFLKKFIELDR
tara:strand:- start:913 stop:1524 length:612 start_codon:yes stop_codon:yes gene_type:complete